MQELLLELVLIHEEVYTTRSEIVKDVISSILRIVTSTAFEYVKEVDKFSVNGELPLALLLSCLLLFLIDCRLLQVSSKY